jgi:ATP-binding cassette subfamily C protein
LGEGEAPDSGFEATVIRVLDGLGVPRRLGPLVALMTGAFVLKGALLLLANSRVGFMVARVATDLRLRLLRGLLAARWSFRTRMPAGVAANAMATEADRAAHAYYNGAQAATHLVEIAIAAAIAFTVSWRASVVAAAAGALSILGLQVFVRMSSRAGRRQTVLLKSLLGRMTDMLGAVKLLKATGREALVGPLLEDDTRSLKRALKKQVLGKEGMRSLQEPILVGFAGVGLWIAKDLLALPASQAVLLILLLARILASVNKFQRKYQNLVVNSSALWSINRLIDEAEGEPEDWQGTRPPSFERGMEFHRVSVAYHGRRVLDDLSLEIPAGTITAVTGASGVGKTTIVDLIVGLVVPDSGRIEVDGTSLPEIDLRAWRQLVGYVPQELSLLHESVRNNVTLGDPKLSDADVEQALRDAGVWEVVKKLPGRLDASVGEQGALLSGGQRQRIAIARALAHRPRLLILDEATAALDEKSEAAIWSTVASLRGRTTVVAISHQPALSDIADRIYWIEDGVARRVDPLPEAGARSAAPLSGAATGRSRSGN